MPATHSKLAVSPGSEVWLEALPILGTVLNGLECGVLVIDQGRVVVASEPFAAMFGQGVEDLMSMTPERLIDYIASLVDDPPQRLRDRRMFADETPVFCEEFELARPCRSVMRWVARRVTSPVPAQIVVCSDITAELDLTAAYERLAVTDRLTGLANRRGAEQVIRREMDRMQRHGMSLSFAMLDLDHFKRINDEHGHGDGDMVLRHVARVIANQLRQTDVAARWGGEEFLLVLPETPIEGAHTCAERIRVALASLVMVNGLRITLSGGVAQMSVGETLEHALERADQQLYKAKSGGRNRIL